MLTYLMLMLKFSTNRIKPLVQSIQTINYTKITITTNIQDQGQTPKGKRLQTIRTKYPTIRFKTRIDPKIVSKPMPSIPPVRIGASQNALIAGIKTGIRIISHFSILP